LVAVATPFKNNLDLDPCAFQRDTPVFLFFFPTYQIMATHPIQIEPCVFADVVPTFVAEVSARKNQPYWQSMSAVSIAVSVAVAPFLSHPKVNIYHVGFLNSIN